MSKKMWMVRAGRNAVLAQEFEEKGYVAVGWIELGDLSSFSTKEDIEKVHKEAYSNQKAGKERLSIGMISRFRFEMKVGDDVISYNSELRKYLVGEITSDYLYRPDSAENYNHIREVNWKGSVSRDDLTVETRNSVGAVMTLFLLGDSAREEFNNLLSGKKPVPTKETEESTEEDFDDLRKETIEKSFEFIKDRIQELDWEKMQELVAGILRAMGYKTRVTSPGPDRGADVIASPDGLGLEQPRIRCEVKHRDGSVGAPLLRSFIGGLRQNDKGLYVSTGGFSREARYEAERSTVPVTLVDIDELVELLTQYYDSADSETKALVPLVKLYWPA